MENHKYPNYKELLNALIIVLQTITILFTKKNIASYILNFLLFGYLSQYTLLLLFGLFITIINLINWL